MACGKGKTTEIFDFIVRHYDEGILYCVDTIAELQKMYDKLYGTLVLTGKIFPEDLLMITSNPDINARGNLYSYHSNPEQLFTKKILLITHIRFFTSLINLFLIYRPASPIPPFDGNFQSLLTRGDLRQWIFFDETPMWIRPFCVMPRCCLGNFSDIVNGQWCCKSPVDIRAWYEGFIKNTKEDPIGHQNRLDMWEEESIMSMIPNWYLSWQSEPQDKDISICFRPRDLAVPGAHTHVLFFEGAADLLLQNSPFTLLHTQGKKYNANVYFEQIPFSAERGKNFNPVEYEASLEAVIDIIVKNRQYNQKTLVCVWKNNDNSKEDLEESNISQFRGKVIEQIIYGTQLRGIDCQGYFSVIYYGENKCKSCNDFVDYSSIILFGRWFLPGSKCVEHNQNWGTNIQPLHLQLWFFVQLISRIGIRKHDGADYWVYITEDFGQKIIEHLYNYFNKDIVPITRTLEQSLKDVKIDHRYCDSIKKLCDIDPNLLPYILNGDYRTQYDLYIPDGELKKILSDKGRHFSRNKDYLEKALSLLNVKICLAP
jgi:hypothetical protein